MRSNLWDDPRIGRLCDITGSSEATVIGALYWLWANADQHSEDGSITELTLRQIDRKTGIAGFGDALCAIKWLAELSDGVRIIRFEEHNGSSAKKRAMTGKRVADHRSHNAPVTHDALQNDNASVTGALTREEKKKSKSHTPHTPLSGGNGEETVPGKPAKKAALSLKSFLESCKECGEKPIPEGDPVFSYAEETGIPVEFLRLHWLEFKARYCQPDAKRYKDWRSVYRKSVRANWFRVWYLKADGSCGLTTVGEQAKRAHGREAA